LAVIGTSTGGAPNTPLRFGSAAEAKTVLRSGNLLEAIIRAFDPSAQTASPAMVIGMRVNPATQATLTLKDAGGADVIDLVATDYGQYSNQIKINRNSTLPSRGG
jgi:hypothetical protein